MRRSERPVLSLPGPLMLAFVLLLAAQILTHHYNNSVDVETDYQQLASPLSASFYRGASLGSEQLMGYLLAIRLQLHDNQVGRHVRYDRIDYFRLVEWLATINQLDQNSEYPMLLASRVYSQTGDHQRLRTILEFVENSFDDNPQLHWRRVAESSVIAKHQLEDLDLALRFAEKLALQPESVVMPPWARDMRFLLLAELNQLELAIMIVKALLQTDVVKDPDEKSFLLEKLSDFQQKLLDSQQKPIN
jgi:hypothetical protein